MKPFAIVYASRTGNTKKIAEAMYEEAQDSFDIYDAKDNPDLSSYEFIIFGYGVDKGSPYTTCLPLMQSIENKTVALFHTLGAEAMSPHALSCAANGGQSLGRGNYIVGYFSCQGAIDPKLIERMKQMPMGGPHAPTPENIERWAKAAERLIFIFL